MASIIHATGHGLVAGDTFKFANVLPTDSGIDETVLYYVLAAGLGADQFEFSTSAGGTPFVLTKAITDGSLIHDDTFDVVVDGIMDPPPTPATPTGLAWTSAVALDADGHQTIRIDITIDAATDPQTRNVRVEITGPAGQAAVVVLQPDETAASFVGAIGNVSYSLTAKAYDVFGNASAATAAVVHTTAKDTTAPAVPTGLAASNGILGIGVVWNSNTEADFDHYDVLVDDDVAFGSPLSFTFRGSLASITPLTAPQTYYVKVRAVDTSGNASAYCTAVSAAARLTGTSDLDPTAIINQATNLINGPATVTVDSTGLTVEDGALILKDEFGTTVMVASGFSGSWEDFVSLGLYNCRFIAGVAGTVPNGRTVALPYWTVSDDLGTPTLEFTDPGLKITWATFNTTKRITSDMVSVIAGRPYEVQVTGTRVNFAGTLGFSAIVFWYKADGSPSDTASTTVVIWDDGGSAGSGFLGSGLAENYGAVTAPTDAYFAKLAVTVSETIAHNASNEIDIAQVGLHHSNRVFNTVIADTVESSFTDSTKAYHLSGGTLRLTTNAVGTNAAVAFGASGNGDTRIMRSAIKTLYMDDNTGGDMELDVQGALSVSGVLTTGTVVVLGGLLRANVATISIDANQNNWNPTGLGSCTLLRISGLTATRTITGIVAGTQGDILILDNDSGSSLVLASDSASSTAANQLRLPAATSITIRSRGMVGLVYDNSRWRAFSVAA